ncbi:MAG: acyl-CoA dehydrogenase family protein [Bryobacteraceae bacterium]|jgi:alkylation response protein AidB-like acyl-CoA dehydrogenase
MSHLDAALEALQTKFAERAEEHDRDGSFPFENFSLLHEFRLLSLTIPRDVGGGGANLATTARVIRAIAQAEPATALVVIMQYLFHLGIVQNSRWPRRVREIVQRDAVENGALINALRVEPELGTPARGGLPATTARRIPEGWTIAGHKLYSTGIPILTWLGVWGRTDETEPRTGFFLIHRNSPGIRVIESWDHLGMRASGSHEVIFEDVIIPEDHAVDVRSPSEWTGIQAGHQNIWMSVLLAELYNAVARAGRDWLIRFATRRVPSNLGAPLATLPRFQEALGSIEALLWANRSLLDRAIDAIDRGEPLGPREGNLLKFTVTNNAIASVEKAIELTGNHGLDRRNPLERHYRDVLCGRIHTPQNDAILTEAGRAALGAAKL